MVSGGGRWVVGVVGGAVHGGDAAEMGMAVAVGLSDCLTTTTCVDRDLILIVAPLFFSLSLFHFFPLFFFIFFIFLLFLLRLKEKNIIGLLNIYF